MQYCANEHRRLLEKHGLIASMSTKGNSTTQRWESWNQVEAIHGERFAAREQAKAQVFDSIEVYCNRTRLHSTPGLSQPEQFELRRAA